MNNSHNKTNPTTIELFAGAGGLALGLEKAGFKTIGLIESDKTAAKTLKTNRPQWNIICEDAETIANLNLPQLFQISQGELDLLSGGAPCQAFSYAGKGLGLNDTRGTLFHSFAVFLEKLQPKVFLFENVRGLITHDNGRTLKTITNVFENIGYTTQQKLLNAWDYNVPQKRERLFIIGTRNDLTNIITINFPTPNPTKPTLKDALKNVPNSAGASYSDYKKKIVNLVPQGGYWKDIPEDIAKEYMKKTWYGKGGRTGILRRLDYNEPSLTILTSPSQKQTDRIHPTENRPLTIRETARIQCFPDDWVFYGSIANQYKQIGNAVPINLAHAIAQNIHQELTKLDST